MPVREIKTTLALDGEKKFSAAIRDAQRSLKVMKAETEAESKALEANGKAMKAAETRAKGLKQQQEQQKKVIKALENAVKESAKAYGENSKQTDGYRIKLANARKELANMEETEKKATKEAKNASKGFAELKKELSDSGFGKACNAAAKTLSGLGKVAGGVFAGIVTAAAGAGAALYNWSVDAAKNADDLITQSMQTGIDVETLQAWTYAARFVDTEVDAITGSVQRLRRNMASGGGAFNDALAALGVRSVDEAGQYRDAVDVFWDVVDVMNTNPLGMNETQMGDTLQTLFGKSYDDLLPLIKAGRGLWEAYVAEANNNGLVLSTEQVSQFGDFDDTLQGLDATIGSIKDNLALLVLPDIKDVVDQWANLLTTLNQFVQGDATGEDVEGAAKGLLDTLVEKFKTAVTAVNEVITQMMESDDPTIKGIGEFLKGISDGFAWIGENAGELLKGVGDFVTALMSIAEYMGQIIEVCKEFGLFGTPEGASETDKQLHADGIHPGEKVVRIHSSDGKNYIRDENGNFVPESTSENHGGAGHFFGVTPEVELPDDTESQLQGTLGAMRLTVPVDAVVSMPSLMMPAYADGTFSNTTNVNVNLSGKTIGSYVDKYIGKRVARG